jgi:PAS domain-containing protein
MTAVHVGAETLRAQVRFLSRAIAASAVLLFTSVALPWLLRIIDVDLAPLAWTLTAFAAVHAALTLATERARETATLRRLLHIVPMTGVAFMAVLWHFGGGAAHPALALMIALPVVAAAALPRAAFAYDVALYAIVVVTVTVAITSPDFGWYVTQLGVPGAAVARLATEEALTARDPFPGATTTPAAMFLFVVTFAVVELAVAAIATRVVKFVRAREDFQLRVQEGELETLPAIAVRATPAASLLVISGTGQIVQATKRFAQQSLLHNQPIVGHELFEFLAFADAAAVRALLATGGTVPFCRYRIGAEERIATIEAETFVHEGTTYASVVLQDWNDAGYLAAAAASSAQPLLVLGVDARVRYANDAAGAAIADLYTGRDLAPLLGDWWRAGGTQRVVFDARTFDATSTPVQLFGNERASIVTFAPAGEDA